MLVRNNYGQTKHGKWHFIVVLKKYMDVSDACK